MTATIEMAAVDVVAITATLRPGDDLPSGSYRLRTDRCVVEVSARVLGRPVLRGRIKASTGALTVNDLATLELELLPDSLRTSVPFTRRRLAAGFVDMPLALRSRSVHTTDDTVVLTASGPLPRRLLWLELAAEFVR
jgi:hypothetical protein